MSIIKELGARFSATDKGITSAMQGIEKGLDNIERKTRDVNKRSGGFFDNMQKKAESTSKVFTNIGDNVKNIGRPIADVGSSLNNWITKPAIVATGAVAGMFGGLGAKRLIGLDNAKAKLEGMGYSTEEVGAITEDVTKAVEGGMTTMAEGVDIAAGAMGAGVEEGKELQRYIKLVGDAAIAGQAPVGEMAQVFNRIQGQGKLMRNELDMIEYRMPGFTSSMVESMGVSRDEFEEMVSSGEVTSEQFLDAMEKYSGGAAEAYAQTFEGMGKNALAYVGILGETMLESIFEDGKAGMARLIELLQSPEALEAARKIGEALKSALDKIIEFIKKVVNWWQSLDDETRSKYKSIAKWIGILAVAIGPVLLVIGKLIMFFGSLFTAVGTIISVIGTAIGWFGSFVSVVGTVVGWVTRLLGIVKFLVQMFLAFASPVTIVIAAIAALGAAFVLAYKKSETFRNFIDGLKDKLMSALSGIIEFKDRVVGVFKAMFAMFKGDWTGGISILQKLGMSDEQILKIQNVVLKIQKFFHDLKERVNAILSAMGNFFKTIFDFIISVANTSMNFIKQAIIPIMQQIFSVVSSILSSVYNVFKSIFNAVLSVVKFIFGAIYDAIKFNIQTAKYIIEFTLRLIYTIFKTIFNAIKSVVSTVVTFIVSFVRSRFETMKKNINFILTAVKVVISTIWNAIKSVISTVVSTVVTFVRTKFNQMKAIISTIMTAVRSVMSTIWNAIRNVVMSIVTPLVNRVRSMFNTMRSALTSIMNRVRSMFSSIWNAIRTAVMSIVNPLISRVRSAFNSLRKALSSIMNRIRNTFSTVWNAIRSTITRIATNIFTSVRTTFNNMKNRLTSIMNTLKTAVTSVWKAVKKTFTDVADNIYDGVTGTFKKMKDTISDVVDGIGGFVDDMVDGVKKGLNKLIDGVNWVADKIGMDKLPSFSTGTTMTNRQNNLVTNGKINRDTFATVGDKGRGNGKGGFRHEMIRYPNGKTILTPDTDTTAYLPRGSVIYNGRQTQGMLPQFSTGTIGDFLGGAGEVRKANKGMTGNFQDNKVGNTQDGRGINKLVEGSQGGIFRKIGSAVKSVVGKASDIIGDVFDYIKDPSKLVDKVFDAFGLDFGFLEGSLFNDALTGMIGKLKQGIATFFKGGLESAGKGDGSSFTGYSKSTPYSPNAPVPGYPRSFNNGHHYGIDYRTPTGTVLKATNTGTVSRMSDRGGGLVAKLLTGKFTQFFLHLSSILKTGKVKQGEAFARTGNSGEWTTGPHLHYQVEKGNSPWVTNRNTVDPEKYLKGIKGYARGDIINSPQLAWLAEGGFSESVISHDPKHQARSKAIYDRTGEMLGFNEDTYHLMTIVSMLTESNELQEEGNDISKVIANKETNIEMDGERVGRITAPHVDQEIKRKEKLVKKYRGGVRTT